VLSLYSGQAILWLPGVVPASASGQLYNARYGAEMVVPAAVFLTIFVRRWSLLPRAWFYPLVQIVFVMVIATQTVLTTSSGIITLQDGLYGVSCEPHHPIAVYLAQHYEGGRILEDTSTSNIVGAPTGIDFNHVIYEGSGPFWTQALRDPASEVDWVLVNPSASNDQVTKGLDVSSPAFLAQFTRVAQESNGLQLFHRNGGPPLPTRPIPSNLLNDHPLCPLR
jgi:hypothetical protein